MQFGKAVIEARKKTVIAVGSRIGACSGGIWLAAALAISASAASISGTVKDSAGKATRGARITVTLGNMSISRFSDQAGRYQSDGLKPGHYEVTATAWGFEQKRESRELSGDVEMNFTLAPQWNVGRLSTTDWLSALPENEDTLTLRATCIRCHNLSYVFRRKGLTSQRWTNLVLYMGRFGDLLQGKQIGIEGVESMFRATPEIAAKMGSILEKYFGPNSAPPTREQVLHPQISDAALRATFREYKPPTKDYFHSIIPDRDGKYVWFTYFTKNKLGRFEIATGKFLEIQLPGQLPSGASTMLVGKNKKERVWLSTGGKLYEVEARSGEFSEHTPPMKIGRTMLEGEDSAGNIWLAGDSIVKFDPRTAKFEEFQIPKVSTPGEDYERNLGNVKTEGQKEFGSWAYALAVDSKDNIWYTHYDVGHIARLDPKTKETKMYRIPDAIKIKGITVGPDDTVWFGNFVRGKLGKLDPTTGQIEQYQAPTRYVAYYTAVVDRKGQVWLSDFSGSHLTKFNPTTKEFTEFPLPASDGMVRFFGLDPQGRVWYVDFDTGVIGVLDPGDTPVH